MVIRVYVLRSAILFPQLQPGGCSMFTPPLALTSSPTLTIFCLFFIGAILMGVKWYITMVLIYIFLMSRDGEHHVMWI